jgi:hypothetical protein
VVRLVQPVFEKLARCVWSFRGRATQGASSEAPWAALLSLPRLVLRPMADFISAGRLSLDPPIRSLITVTTAQPNGRHELSMHCFPSLALTDPLPMGGHRHLPHFQGPVPTLCPLRNPFHNGVSAKVANLTVGLAAVREYRRAMEVLNFHPVASGRGVREE